MGSINHIKLGVLFLLAQVVWVYGQEQIPWSPDFRLNWANFKGDVPNGANAAATTASGISYDFSTYHEGGDMKVNFNVHAYFYPTRSWYRPTVCNDNTLLHEQLHFDITELYARKLRTRLQNASFGKNIKEEVRKIYKATLRQLNDFQNKYDAETNYSRNLTVQERWVGEIEAVLKQ
ncbi:DUF922 domain-containing protein [Maribacter confluentis]|uniref:DUF922 domain-containing protein n=1 Tax=Maribacter confluentis TaxID=1656093 RepID=A0ABT8RVR0_9FLAO|nr:DUF922 domain-containing protein [Maribacter confluentis]MDO1511783.1 DUF922 domain-containing protein [Maribacter confluentis]MDO1514810.1 DUF922 domain-containing protein [Maribacter confluentis]